MIADAIKVLASEVHGRTLVFDSINDCCDYYTEVSTTRLQVAQLRRLIAGSGLWQFTEKETGTVRQVFFDELA